MSMEHEMQQQQSRISDPVFLCGASIAIVAALRLLPLALPGQRLWALDAFLYLDAALVALFLLLLLVFALPPLHARLTAVMGIGGSDRQWRRRTLSAVVLLFIAVMLFPMKTFFYGDGGAFVTEVFKIGAQEGYSSDILLNLHSAPLAGGVLHALANLIPSVFHFVGLTLPATPLYPFHALALIGVILLYPISGLARDARDGFLSILLIGGSGAVLLFFSYAEMYLPVTLAITAFLLTGMKTLRDEQSPLPALLFFIIAVLAHYMTLALLPALLLLLFRNHAMTQRLAGTGGRLALTWSASMLVAAVAYWALGFTQSDSRIVMPLLDVESEAGVLSYTLLSAAHVIDLLQLPLLLAGPALVYLLLSALFVRNRPPRIERRFLMLGVLYFAAFLFFANTSLGLPRDWDIAAPLGIMLMLLVPYAGGRNGSGQRGTTAVIAGASFAFILPWLAVNIDDDTAAQRFEAVMQLDDERMYGDYALSGYEALRKYYLHHGRLEDEERVLRRMIGLVGYAEQYRLLVTNAFTRFQRDQDASIALQLQVLEHLQSRADMLLLTGKQRDYAISRWEIDSLAAAIAAESIMNHTMTSVFVPMRDLLHRAGLRLGHDILIGAGWYLDERFAEAAEALRPVWESNYRDARVDGMYASGLTLAGHAGTGDAVFADAARFHSKHPTFLLIYATTQLQADRRHGEARSALELALAAGPPEASRAQIQEILAALDEIAAAPLPWMSVQPELGSE
jgi:hypothetical protein